MKRHGRKGPHGIDAELAQLRQRMAHAPPTPPVVMERAAPGRAVPDAPIAPPAPGAALLSFLSRPATPGGPGEPVRVSAQQLQEAAHRAEGELAAIDDFEYDAEVEEERFFREAPGLRRYVNDPFVFEDIAPRGPMAPAPPPGDSTGTSPARGRVSAAVVVQRPARDRAELRGRLEARLGLGPPSRPGPAPSPGLGVQAVRFRDPARTTRVDDSGIAFCPQCGRVVVVRAATHDAACPHCSAALTEATAHGAQSNSTVVIDPKSGDFEAEEQRLFQLAVAAWRGTAPDPALVDVGQDSQDGQPDPTTAHDGKPQEWAVAAARQAQLGLRTLYFDRLWQRAGRGHGPAV